MRMTIKIFAIYRADVVYSVVDNLVNFAILMLLDELVLVGCKIITIDSSFEYKSCCCIRVQAFVISWEVLHAGRVIMYQHFTLYFGILLAKMHTLFLSALEILSNTRKSFSPTSRQPQFFIDCWSEPQSCTREPLGQQKTAK